MRLAGGLSLAAAGFSLCGVGGVSNSRFITRSASASASSFSRLGSAMQLPHDIPLSPEQLIAIGCVTSQWGRLEFEIDWQISMLKVKPACVDLNISLASGVNKRFSSWVHLANVAYRDKAARDAVADIASRARAAKPDRDAVVHGTWAFQLGPDERPTKTFWAIYRYARIDHSRQVSMDATEILAIATTISAINRDLFRYLDTVIPR